MAAIPAYAGLLNPEIEMFNAVIVGVIAITFAVKALPEWVAFSRQFNAGERLGIRRFRISSISECSSRAETDCVCIAAIRSKPSAVILRIALEIQVALHDKTIAE